MRHVGRLGLGGGEEGERGEERLEGLLAQLAVAGKKEKKEKKEARFRARALLLGMPAGGKGMYHLRGTSGRLVAKKKKKKDEKKKSKKKKKKRGPKSCSFKIECRSSGLNHV